MTSRSSLAVDFDGVVADTGTLKCRWLQRELGIRTLPDLTDRSSLLRLVGLNDYLRMQASIGLESTLTALPLPGCTDALEKISKKFSILIVTARSSENTVWISRWLDQYGLIELVNAVIETCASPKVLVARQLGCSALVDNDLRHLLGRDDVALRRLYFSQTGVVNDANVERVRSWTEVVEKLLPPNCNTRATTSNRSQ